jgi:hypothetical protein
MALVASLTAGSAQAAAGTGNSLRPGTAAGMAAIAGGTVTGASGAAMPGVTIELYAWPSDRVLAAMKPGQPVPATLLAASTTSRAGTYLLRVPESELQAAAPSDFANLEIRSALGGSRFLSYPMGTLPAWLSAPVTVNLNDKSSPDCGSDAQHPYGITGFALLRQLKPAPTIIGQGYIVQQKKTAGDFMQFHVADQTSLLGVGISEYGSDAGYVNSGTNTSAVSGPADFPNEPKNTLFRTAFNVGQFRAECFSADSSTPHQKQHGKCPRTIKQDGATLYVHKCLWLVKSTGWSGGTSVVHPEPTPATPAKFCTAMKANTVFKTGNEKAVRWPSGFEIGTVNDIKGADLKTNFNTSAQTGYDSNAQMQFHFKQAGFACGTTKAAPSSPIVVMRGTKP